MIRKIVIVGGGSAGFLSSLALKARLPEMDVSILRSPEIGIIGVGEGTTNGVPHHLHCNFKLDPSELHRQVKVTWKLGVKFLWGPRPYFNFTFSPQFSGRYEGLPKPNAFYDDGAFEFVDQASALMTLDKAFPRDRNGTPNLSCNQTAYHLENADFVAYLETKARERGVQVTDDTVDGVEQDQNGVIALLCHSGRRVEADFWIDCSGFSSFLLSKTLGVPFVSFKRSLFCDRAIVGGWDRGQAETIKPYTTAETMDSGWCWQIEHDHRVNRGYVYSSSFISDSDAEEEFRRKNPKIGPTRIVRFISGYYERGWVKNVVGIGNAAGFVEPLESTSLFVICDAAWALAESLADCDLQPDAALGGVYNKWSRQTWESIRGFLGIHYKFNTRLETPFWRACREETDLGGRAQEYISYFEERGPSPLWMSTLLEGRDVFDSDGWLTMLVGQKVPYRHTYTPSEAEQRTWKKILAGNWAKTANGLNVAEMSRMVRSPEWQFPKDFFRLP
jgi:tryptophan 7-halogenase